MENDLHATGARASAQHSAAVGAPDVRVVSANRWPSFARPAIEANFLVNCLETGYDAFWVPEDPVQGGVSGKFPKCVSGTSVMVDGSEGSPHPGMDKEKPPPAAPHGQTATMSEVDDIMAMWRESLTLLRTQLSEREAEVRTLSTQRITMGLQRLLSRRNYLCSADPCIFRVSARISLIWRSSAASCSLLLMSWTWRGSVWRRGSGRAVLWCGFDTRATDHVDLFVACLTHQSVSA